MKYIIQESRLENVLNTYLDERFKNSIIYEDDYITVSDYYTDESTEIVLDYENKTLFIKKDFLKTTNNIFPVGFEKLSELITLWFGSKFDVKVEEYDYSFYYL